jgi:arsenate reductase
MQTGLNVEDAASVNPRPRSAGDGAKRSSTSGTSRPGGGESQAANWPAHSVLSPLGLPPLEAGRLAAMCVADRGANLGTFADFIHQQRDAITRRRAELDRLEAEIQDLELTARETARGTHLRTAIADRIGVLFVCTGNSARSQLAEALLRQLGGAEFEAASAGTRPRPIHALTIEVLREIGVDWRGARTKSVHEVGDRRWDYVITVCDRARRECPKFPGSYDTLHWGLDDPAAVAGSKDEQLEAFRQTRQELTVRLHPFIELARARQRPANAVASALGVGFATVQATIDPGRKAVSG